MKNTPDKSKAPALVAQPGAPAPFTHEGTLSVQAVLGQVQLIQQILGSVMKEGEHYGRVPGCGDRPTLLKPGAEKLCFTFRLAPTYEVQEREGERGNREYRITCALTAILGGYFVGEGVGICSTMEAKYRFRAGNPEPTDNPVPRAYWDAREENPAQALALLGGKGFTAKKIDGKGWMICKGGEKVEHDNPADHYNTVLKMAKKRALVDAVLTCTAASDIFTQDLEDITANLAAYPVEAVVLSQTEPVPALPAPVRSDRAPRSDDEQEWPEPGSPAPPDTRPAAKTVSEGQDSGRTKKPVESPASAPNGPHVADPGPELPLSGEPAPLPAAPVVSDAVAVEETQEPAAPAQPAAWTRATVHFGKNRGRPLLELTPGQREWYHTDWMHKREVAASKGKGEPMSKEDEALFVALKEWKRCHVQQNAVEVQCDKHGFKPSQVVAHIAAQGGPEFTRLEEYPEDGLRNILATFQSIALDMVAGAC